ncbi:hypothetical protein DRQ53_12720 [bacterium]|nr:MAG: hypothetical protein DRQ32_01415 [bacterium]RKZ13847.1 MAG: hypothetical protein DRQ53_12720 [bacterium]
MLFHRRLHLLWMLIAITSLVACSDDDDPVTPPEPEDPRVESIVISPGSMTFNGIGEEARFDAVAFDQESAPIDTVFTWQSSDLSVIAVDANGDAVATGLGTAEIYAMAGSVTDTADVTVTLDGAPTRTWIAGGSGNWEDAGNWSDGIVPGAGDVVLISEAGDYTVSLNSDVEVEGLVLGNESGTQTLDTNGRQLGLSSGGLFPGAELLVEDDFLVRGDFVWNGGAIAGSGIMEIEGSGELHVIGNPLDLNAALRNNGTITAHAGCSLRVNEALDNNGGGLFDFQGDATVTVQNNGDFTNAGTIRKSQGEDAASLFASSADFSSSGSLLVGAGSLQISGGSLRGRIEIDADAMLRLSGNSEILSANSHGDGPLVIAGRVELGSFAGQTITLRHLILDSGSIPALSGPAGLLVDHSFVWRRGTVHELGSLNTQIGSQTRFENGGSKSLSAVRWSIRGNVAGDNAVDVSLVNGATIQLESPGNWMQAGAGTIKQGSGDTGSFDVLGNFQKTGEGAFVVESSLNCSGTLDLREDALTVQGDFKLSETGIITGGGTADLVMNRRLILVDATSAVIGGTIRPDLDGQPARMDIQGLVELESTCSIELDVETDGAFNTESVYFLTGGQAFNGTLALNVLRPVDAMTDYKVIYAFAASGQFTVTGDLQFDDVVQDDLGVVCRRF